jgi:mRNA interferase RelE/StbE
MLDEITNRDIQDAIRKRIRELVTDPEKQGKPLLGPLQGFRCVRAFHQRYRILYRVDRTAVVVMVVALGIRKEGDRQDIYTLAQKILRSGLLGPP